MSNIYLTKEDSDYLLREAPVIDNNDDFVTDNSDENVWVEGKILLEQGYTVSTSSTSSSTSSTSTSSTSSSTSSTSSSTSESSSTSMSTSTTVPPVETEIGHFYIKPFNSRGR